MESLNFLTQFLLAITVLLAVVMGSIALLIHQTAKGFVTIVKSIVDLFRKKSK